jgi:hypothetical protein
MGAEQPAASELVEDHAALHISLLELAQQVLDLLERGRREPCELVRLDWLVADKNQRLDQPAKVGA